MPHPPMSDLVLSQYSSLPSAAYHPEEERQPATHLGAVPHTGAGPADSR
jgi:hypothetical protein